MFLPDKEKSAAVNVQSESVNQSWAMALNAPGVPCWSSVADSWWRLLWLWTVQKAVSTANEEEQNPPLP